MKKENVTIGRSYRAKVTGKLTTVRITAENPHGGWDAVNLTTGKAVRIKSAQRLRGRFSERGAARGAGPRVVSRAEYEAQAPAAEALEEVRPAASGRGRSLLDAAVIVLAEDGEAMTCGQIVQYALARGLWSPRKGGKTPANTLSAAMRREIKTAGEESHFRLVDRGLFQINH